MAADQQCWVPRVDVSKLFLGWWVLYILYYYTPARFGPLGYSADAEDLLHTHTDLIRALRMAVGGGGK
jgi:hypothetical protein